MFRSTRAINYEVILTGNKLSSRSVIDAQFDVSYCRFVKNFRISVKNMFGEENVGALSFTIREKGINLAHTLEPSQEA